MPSKQRAPAPAPATPAPGSANGRGEDFGSNSFLGGLLGMSTEEAIGTGVGAGIGGIVAGPLGAVVGGWIGNQVGDWFDGDTAEQEAPRPTTGLGSYDVVPDDFVGPLGPNQIRQADSEYLNQYDFGSFDVVGDDFVGPLSNGQMRQGDYDSMQRAWLGIRDGNGMSISGSDEDREAYLQHIRATMTDSPTTRDLISEIGNDTDPTHVFQNNVGRSQPGTFVDRFDNSAVDLDDIEAFPVAAGAADTDAMTRGEQLVHILAERRDAMTSGNPNDFGPAHSHATDAHNAYRAERGQVAETGAVFDGNDCVMSYEDGTARRVVMNNNSEIQSFGKEP